jgi:hypothetical protein
MSCRRPSGTHPGGWTAKHIHHRSYQLPPLRQCLRPEPTPLRPAQAQAPRLVQHRGHRINRPGAHAGTAAFGSNPCGPECQPANGRDRRILLIPARSGRGRLTERTPAVPPRRRERLKVPLSRPSRARSAGRPGSIAQGLPRRTPQLAITAESRPLRSPLRGQPSAPPRIGPNRMKRSPSKRSIWTCLSGAKSVGLVLIVMPSNNIGNSR